MGKHSCFPGLRSSFAKHSTLNFLFNFICKGGICIIILPLILAVAAFMDFKYEKVPNLLILSGFGCGIFVRVLQGNLWEADAFWGLVIPVLLFWPLFVLRAMGAGDVKLMSMMGFCMGVRSVLAAIAVAIAVAALMGVIRTILTGRIWARLRYLWEYLRLLSVNIRLGNTALPEYRWEDARGGERVHFAVALFVGGIVTMGGYI